MGPKRGAELLDGFSARLAATGSKRDSFQAELERDPSLAPSAKKQQFSNSLSVSAVSRDLATAQTTLLETQKRLREANARIESLERDRRYLAEREAEEKDGRERDRDEFDAQTAQLNTTLSTLRNALAVVQQENGDIQEEISELRMSSSKTIDEQNATIATLQSQVEARRKGGRYSDLSDDATQTMEFTMPSFSSLNASTSTVRPPSPEPQPQQNQSFAFTKQESELLEKEMKSTLEHLRRVESHNTKLEAELVVLRQRKERVNVLEEQKREMATRLQGMESLRKKVVELEQTLHSERSRNTASSSSATSDSKLAIELTQLRSSHLTLLDAHGELKASHADTLAQLQHAETALAQSQSERDTMILKKRALEDDLRKEWTTYRMQKMENEHLRKILASYQAESESFSIDQAVRAYNAEIEKLLEEYKAENENLRSQVKEAISRSSANTSMTTARMEQAVSQLSEEKDGLSKENAFLLEQIDTLEQRVHDLSGDLANGSLVPPGKRVLSMKQNPEQEWFDMREEVFRGLRGECDALRARVAELEGRVREGGGSLSGAGTGEGTGSEGLVPRESWEMINKEKEKLEEELKAKDKRMLRLRQVFSSKGEEFKDAVTSILGVKLSFHASGQIRVTSVYDLNASFVFKPLKSGDGGKGVQMQLVATNEEVSEEIPELMRNWIEQHQCPPCFMASVTLDSWEKQTLGS